jgi:phage terminase small subunit
MPNKLTPKQEAFALNYVEIGNATEAYRQSYNAENMSDEATRVEACRTLANPNIALRVAELQTAAQERTLVTVESITRELDEAKQLATTMKNPTALTTAIMGKAKVNGLLLDKSEVKHSGNVSFQTVYDPKPE